MNIPENVSVTMEQLFKHNAYYVINSTAYSFKKSGKKESLELDYKGYSIVIEIIEK